MKISVVGNVLKDVYLDLDTKHEPLETDRNGTSWLDIAFDTSEHHFFSRTSSLGGAAISLEVLEKLGLPTHVIGADLELKDGNLKTNSLAGTYRYILLADDAVSYFVPVTPAVTPFSAPREPIDYLYIDRSTHLSRETASQILAYLDLSGTTRLALYLEDPNDPCYHDLIKRADLIFLEHHTKTAASHSKSTTPGPSPLASVKPEKIVHLSETELRYCDIRTPLSLERIDMLTHLSLFSVAASTILGAFVLGRTVENSLALAATSLTNSHLNAVLPLSDLDRILENSPTSTPDKSNLELIAASLVMKPKGILAADESGGSIEKKFAQLNIPDTYQNRRDYRNIFFTTPHLSDFVNGVILFDETTRQTADNGQNFTEYLTSLQIIPGIKVDQGLEHFPDTPSTPADSSTAASLATTPSVPSPAETYTKGLEGLPERLAEYYQRGLRFAKWRAAFEIRLSDNGALLTPTEAAIVRNCEILADYALDCQNAGLVPIVEPEVVYDGHYSAGQNADVTGHILDVLFATLKNRGVNLRGCLLKVNMILAGKQYQPASTPEEVGTLTARVLKSHVPDDLAGVVFLSGGQTPEQATANLAAITKNGPYPWPVTFSFARALQDPALYAWQGNNANADAARTAFAERLQANSDALQQVDF